MSTIKQTWRYDAEYWHPIHIENEQTIARAGKRSEVKTVYDLVNRITGSAFYPSFVGYYDDAGMPFIRVADLGNFFLKEDGMVRVDPRIIAQYRQVATIGEGDIVIAKGGSIGGVCVVQPGMGKCAVCRDVIALETDPRRIDSLYLVAFLRSRFGQFQLDRYKSQQVQAHLTFPAVGNVEVVVPPRAEQITISHLIQDALAEQKRSETLYAEAEALLLAELGLASDQTSEVWETSEVSYTQSFSQAWAAGRLDAEYFQPRYYALLARLQETGQSVRLGDWLVEPIRRGVQPEYDDNGDVIVINSQHVGKTHVELEDNRRTTRTFAGQNPRAAVRPYDVLLNSTGYITIGRCQTLLPEVPAIVDGHVSIIRPKPGLDPVYLGLFLNTLPGQMQTERSWTGSSGQIELRTELIENYTIWKPDMAFQQRLRGLVERAHTAREEARRLLEEAKRRVEELVLG